MVLQSTLVDRCPYCRSTGQHFIRHYTKTYLRCDECGLIYRKRAEAKNQSRIDFYQQKYFSLYSRDQVEGNRSAVYEHAINEIEKIYASRGSLLDIGAGIGQFLMVARRRGWQVKGVEPSEESVAFAKAIGNLNIQEGTIQSIDFKEKYDTITLINVLDYTDEPWEDIKKAKTLLKKKGIIYIRFTNAFLHAMINRIANRIHCFQDLNRYLVFHKYAFTHRYIMRMMSDLGLESVLLQNSKMTHGDPNGLFCHKWIADLFKKTTFLVAEMLRILSGDRFYLGTSLEIIARKQSNSSNILNRSN